MFYEEVPGRPALLLRTLLPYPVRTDGNKTSVGAMVYCVYRGGDLAKRITTVEPSRLLQFEVIDQRLGIESCILTRGGSYRSLRCGAQSDVPLITNYHAYLRPRCLWRPFEALLVGHHSTCTSLVGLAPPCGPRRSAVTATAAASLTT